MTDDALDLTGSGPHPDLVPDGGYLPGTAWSWWHPIIPTVGSLLGVWIVGLVVLLSTGRTDPETQGFTANELLGLLTPAQFLAGFLTLWLMLRWMQLRSFRTGLGFTVRLSDSWAIAVGVGLQIAAAILLSILASVMFPSGEPPQQSVTEVVGDVSGWAMVMAVLFILVLAPIYEEMVFRGMLLSALLRRMGAWPAYLVSGAAFAGIHVVFDTQAWFASLALFPIGTAFAYMAHRSGDLSRPILAHMGVNLLGVLGLFFADDLERIAEELRQNVEAVARFAGLG